MKRNKMVGVAGSILVAAALSGEAQAQFGGFPPGSTYPGDYLRGVGAENWGLGQYNLGSARATNLNAQTFMMLNKYIISLIRRENQENARHRKMIAERRAKARKAMLDRINNSPQLVDLMKGDALNAVMLDLINPKVEDSSLNEACVPLDPDVVRRIPFRLGEKGETFSMNRLSLKGRWVVAFQDPRFNGLKRAYERAVENALDLAIDGKMNQDAIEAIHKAVAELDDALVHTHHLLEPKNQREAAEARAQVDQIKTTARLFQTHKIQAILAGISTYFGQNVADLSRFMRDHSLGFAPAETPDERSLYPQVYTALDQQRSKAGIADDPPTGRPIKVE